MLGSFPSLAHFCSLQFSTSALSEVMLTPQIAVSHNTKDNDQMPRQTSSMQDLSPSLPIPEVGTNYSHASHVVSDCIDIVNPLLSRKSLLL